MRSLIIILTLVSFSNGISAQTRQEIIEKYKDLNNQAKVLEKTILSPDKADLETAAKENVEVFRLLPRENYGADSFSVRGGGAYYSFSNKSHSYNETPQIELLQNMLSVGFYGANYGFIADLGNIPLAGVNKETGEIKFLVHYKPPIKETEVRSEQVNAFNLLTESAAYRRSISAKIGHSYALRAISFDDTDVLVAFKLHRKDADGSLIIFWKLLETFQIPKLQRV